MTLLPRCVPHSVPQRVLVLALTASCATAAYAQQSGVPRLPSAVSEAFSRAGMESASGAQAAPPVVSGPGLFTRYGLGAQISPLGIGGQFAVLLMPSVNLRTGVSYFSYNTNQTEDDIPFTANLRLQAERVSVDWYLWRSLHVSPGFLFGNSSRAFGSASIAAGNSFTVNHMTYYSSAVRPVQASGSVTFNHVAPVFTLGWGNWVNTAENQGRWTFPFELGFAYMSSPKAMLNFSGVACTDATQLYCENIADDPRILANIAVERQKLQGDANRLQFYPILSGGFVYRF